MNHSLLPQSQLPLHNKRVLITAPRNYAFRLAKEVLNYGGLPIIMPTIETCLLKSFDQLDKCLSNINQFNWIAFTSRNGIDAFFLRLKQLNLPISTIELCKLCAIGKDTERLNELGLTVDLIPFEPSPQGIIKELAKYPDINQQTILVPIPEVIGIPEPDIIPDFIQGLQKLGIKVTPITVYKTQSLPKSLYQLELELIKTGKIDIIAFSSTGEIEAFLSMVHTPKDYQKCLIACFGPYTAKNAQQLGLKVSIIAEDYSSFTGFIKAIIAYFS